MDTSFRNVSFNSSLNLSMNTTISGRRRKTDIDPVILSDDGTFLLEHFGSVLPSMVRVALNKVEDPSTVSVRLSRNGWAWLVSKRQVYIWRYTLDQTGKKPTVPCRELLLPPSELFHHAKLIAVLTNSSSTLPGCIATSPEGHITYWPNISNESATVSINADLPGQECDSLTSVWPLGCVLATTSATVLLIKPGSATKPSLSTISLNSGSKGWLGGLSKRMSYLMPMGTATMETKRASVAASTNDGGRQRNVFVLTGTHYQVWSLTLEGQQCATDLNMHDIIRKNFQRSIWDDNCDIRGIQVWLLDIQSLSDESKKVQILAACVNRTETNGQVHFGILTFVGGATRLRDTMDFQIVNYRCEKTEGEEESLYQWKLLSTPHLSFMVSPDKILLVGTDDSSVDTVSSERAGGVVIGSGHSPDNMPCVFTPNLGLQIIRPNQTSENFMLQESFMDIRVPDHLALSMTHHNLHDLTISEDNVNRYKSAFLHFCAKRQEESSEILKSLFPSNQPSLTPQDPIDIWTVALCEKLMDDAPVADPRWGAAFGRGEGEDPFGLKSKLLIKNFLADKKKGVDIFFNFLGATGIWKRLTGILVKDEVEATSGILYNSYEKIGLAMSLHSLQTDGRYRKVIDPVIKSIVAARSESRPHSSLSFNDIFFKDISRVHQIFPALVQMEEEVMMKEDSKAILATVSLTTEIMLVLFSELNLLVDKDFAQIRHAFVGSLLENPSHLGYVMTPWFVQHPTIEALLKQVKIVLTTSKMTEGSDGGMDLFKQMEQLVDLVLDGTKTQVESLRGSERYDQKLMEFEEERSSLLGHLVSLDPVGTIRLAEKYKDFNTLVKVTYDQGTKEGFTDCFEKYYDHGFPTFTFDWFLKQKKDVELVETFSRSKYAPLLAEFLKDYPTIAWHHSTLNEDFYEASNTLSRLAQTEESSLDDQKFLFCLSKLALLATGTEKDEDTETYDEINRNLEIVQFQNDLSDEVLEAHGMSRETMHVLTPSQMIDMYSSSRTEVLNFWKAACLVKYMPEEIQEEKRVLIVCRAIFCDPWSDWEMDHPLDVILPSILHKFLSYAIANGERLDAYLDLSALSKVSMLENVFGKGNSNYLLKACEESLRGDMME